MALRYRDMQIRHNLREDMDADSDVAADIEICSVRPECLDGHDMDIPHTRDRKSVV